MKKHLFIFLIFLLAACAKPLYQPSLIAVPAKTSISSVKGAILDALNSRSWIVESTSSNEIRARYGKGNKIGKVAISYNTRSVDIRYAGSQGMGYSEGSDGAVIKGKYNGWVMNLENDIAQRLSMLNARK